MKMWSGRFRQPLNPEFENWQRSFPFDRQLLKQEVEASIAHASALLKAGVFTPEESDAVLTALHQVAHETPDPTEFADVEDVHHFVETRLVALAGDVGLKLHTGRSRNEQIATDLRLYVRSQCDEISVLLVSLCDAIVERAGLAGTAAMPAYTHLQRAEPVLVAHWLLACVEMFLRDVERLSDCRARLNQCPLGSAAVAGTFLPLDRRQMSRELGFDTPTANSMDATSDRDFAVEFVQVLSICALHLSRLAEELILFSTQEYGFIELPESYSTGSSAMPQKKNPDSLELIRGKCGAVVAEGTRLLMTIKGLPLAYNKDLQETQEPVFNAATQISAMLSVAAGVVAGMEFDSERMNAAASTGCLNAMSAAGYLVSKGVPFRRAHELVGNAVRLCIEKECELESLSRDDYAVCGIDADAGYYAALSLDAVLACHDVEGGTAPHRVMQALAVAREKLTKLRECAHACA